MQKRLGTALRSYKNKRWVQFYLIANVLAVRTFNRPNNRLHANSNGYAIHNNKGDQVSSIAAIWAIYHHMNMGPPEESVEGRHSYCQMVIRLDVSTTKIKYLTEIYMIDQNVYHLCSTVSFMSTWARSKSERVH